MNLFKQPEPPATLRRLTEDESARLDKTSPRVWTGPKKMCMTCHHERTKTTVYRWHVPGNRQHIVDFQCDCVSQYRLHQWMLYAGIGLAYQRVSWDDLLDVPEDAVQTAVQYATHCDFHINTGTNLLLWSEQPGTGKTYLASMLAKRMLTLGVEVFFATFSEILDLFTATWRDDEERAWFNRRVRSAQVLVVDDLGREHPGRLGVAESMLDAVLRARIAAALPTVMTTNLSPDKLGGYGHNLVSLMEERMIRQEVSGKDKRPQMTLRMQYELANGLFRPIVVD